MTEYTYKDVIIDPDDPRVEIGKEYYYCDYPTGCLERAIKDDVAHLAGLENVYSRSIGHFFIDDTYSICIIRKKETEKKYVPFDLTKEEDRARLRGAWVRFNNDPAYECQVFAISKERVYIWSNCDYLTPEELLRDCVFLDGSPCGKLVEEVR